MTRSIVVLEETLYEYSLEHIKHFGRRLQFFVRATNLCANWYCAIMLCRLRLPSGLTPVNRGKENEICRIALGPRYDT